MVRRCTMFNALSSLSPHSNNTFSLALIHQDTFWLASFCSDERSLSTNSILKPTIIREPIGHHQTLLSLSPSRSCIFGNFEVYIHRIRKSAIDFILLAVDREKRFTFRLHKSSCCTFLASSACALILYIVTLIVCER